MNPLDRDAWVPTALLLAALVVGAPMVSAQSPDSPAGPGLAAGSLVIVGGGRMGPEIPQRFVKLAGGPEAEVVFIPTANGDESANSQAIEGFKKSFGLKNVIVLHTGDRAVADSEAFVAPLKMARGVWFGGGRHWRLADSYLGTRTQREIENVLKRGGVVGGTSAGATILGSFMVRGAREGNHIMVAKDYQQGLGYLQNVAIDQHLLTRGRADDLAPVVAAHPGLLGLGLDESTAIVVTGDQFEVIGRGVVAINDAADHDGKPYYFLGPGERYDLKTRRRVSRARNP